MARPAVATVLAYTSSGVPFQWLTDGYREKGAPDANMAVMQALVAWDDANDFLRDVVGYTTWSGETVFLQRVKPLECPLRPGLYCDNYDLVDMGTDDTRTDWTDPFGDAFEQDWLIYSLTFLRPKYRIFSDETLFADYSSAEQNRYCSFERRYIPRERRVSGFAFEYLKAGGVEAVAADWQTVPDEAAFIPDYQMEYVITWHQVPVGAVPEKFMLARLLTVNSLAFTISTFGQARTFSVGALLFKGPQQGVEAYQGADGAWYEDLRYVFAFQPGGWNNFLRPDLVASARDYGKVRRKKPGGGTDPPYPSSNFAILFAPSTAGPI